jgi:hypothetical protein
MLAYITFLGYLIGYKYEVAYNSYFSIPDDYVQFNLTSILKPTETIIFAIIIIFLVTYAVVWLEHYLDYELLTVRNLLNYIYILSLIYLLVKLYTSNFVDWRILLIGLIICIVFIEFLYRLGRWFIRKIENRHNKKSSTDIPKSAPLFRKEYYIIVSILIFSFFSIATIKYLGEYNARHEDTFFVVEKDQKRWAVLGNHEKLLIIRALDQNNKLTKEFQFIKPEEGSSKKLEIINDPVLK